MFNCPNSRFDCKYQLSLDNYTNPARAKDKDVRVMCAQCGKIVYKKRTSTKLVRLLGLVFLLTLIFFSFSKSSIPILEESGLPNLLGITSTKHEIEGTYYPNRNCDLSSGNIVPFQISNYNPKDESVLWKKIGPSNNTTSSKGSYKSEKKVLELGQYASFEVITDEYGIINLITIENNIKCNGYFKND